MIVVVTIDDNLLRAASSKWADTIAEFPSSWLFAIRLQFVHETRNVTLKRVNKEKESEAK